MRRRSVRHTAGRWTWRQNLSVVLSMVISSSASHSVPIWTSPGVSVSNRPDLPAPGQRVVVGNVGQHREHLVRRCRDETSPQCGRTCTWLGLLVIPRSDLLRLGLLSRSKLVANCVSATVRTASPAQLTRRTHRIRRASVGTLEGAVRERPAALLKRLGRSRACRKTGLATRSVADQKGQFPGAGSTSILGAPPAGTPKYATEISTASVPSLRAMWTCPMPGSRKAEPDG